MFTKKIENVNTELIEKLIENEGEIISILAKQQKQIDELSTYVSELQKTVLTELTKGL